MQSTLGEAKKRLLLNITTNIMVVFVSAVVGIWLTPYFIRHLGIEAYGMIPLVISFIAYFNIFTMSISNAVSRFVAIHLGKNELEESNEYFNSAFFALLALCALFLVPVIILSVFFSKLFQVPPGFETDTGWLFFYIMFSCCITAVSGPFLVGTFIRHRFDLSNSVRMLGRFLQVIIIVLCFTYLAPSLKYFGLSHCGMTLFYLICSVALTKRLAPQLYIKLKKFRWSAFCEMGRMSSWMMLSQVGALLYLNISFVVINLFLGPEQVGRYGPIAQMVTLLLILGGALSNVFTPIAYDYVAHNKVDTLALQIRRSTKFMGLVVGFPVGLMCGLSRPLLQRWLGSEFVDLSPLVWLLVGPWVVNIAVGPMFSIYRGLNKIKVPAIVTIIGGAVNVVISILLVRYTNLGIYGVALALLICLVGKNLFFTPVYAAIITGQRKAAFVKEIATGVVMAGLVSLSALAISQMYDLATVPRLIAVVVVAGLVYVPLCYFIIISKQERTLLLSLIVRQK